MRMFVDEPEEPQFIRVWDALTKDVGGCNFCSYPSRAKRVTVVTSPGGFQARFCARCIGAIGRHKVGTQARSKR